MSPCQAPRVAAITRRRRGSRPADKYAHGWTLPENKSGTGSAYEYVAGLHSAHDLAAHQAACLAKGCPPKLRRWVFQGPAKTPGELWAGAPPAIHQAQPLI
jgi:hypothetical protein